MLGRTFCHSTTLKYVNMFGNMFNDIVIYRKNSNDEKIQSILVPIEYANKQKWSVALSESIDKGTAITLPRMAFVFSSLEYHDDKKVDRLNIYGSRSGNKSTLNTMFQPIPMKIGAQLFIVGKNQDDLMQIIEQILPFFQPDFTNSMHLIPDMEGIGERNIVTTLLSIDQDYSFEGEFSSRNVYIWALNFEIHAWYFGPIQQSGVIKRVQIDLYNIPGSGEITPEQMRKAPTAERIVTTPGLTVDGKPTSNPAETIPYRDIEIDDPYGFITEFQSFDKTNPTRYDPITGEDKPI